MSTPESSISRYVVNNLIAFDQQCNTLIGGYPDETLSARAHRQHLKGRSFMRNFINMLFWWQLDHCRDAYFAEIARTQFDPAYQQRKEI